MDKLIESLGPAFATGLAIQQLLEIADRFWDQILKIIDPTGALAVLDKRFVLNILSFLVALILTIFAGLRVLMPLGIDAGGAGDLADVFVTTLIISAGTESFNSIVKFLGYVKEDRKITATVKKERAEERGLEVAGG
jgi:hypothetical protein